MLRRIAAVGGLVALLAAVAGLYVAIGLASAEDEAASGREPATATALPADAQPSFSFQNSDFGPQPGASDKDAEAMAETQAILDSGWVPVGGETDTVGYVRSEDVVSPPGRGGYSVVLAAPDSDTITGYLVTNIGFVDRETFVSPEFDLEAELEQAEAEMAARADSMGQ